MPKTRRRRSKQSTLDVQYKQVRRSTRTSSKVKDVEEDALIKKGSDNLAATKPSPDDSYLEEELVVTESEKKKLVVTESEKKLLRQFDLNPDFGPCIDITRLERWERAEKYGKSPPHTIRELILTHPNKDNVMIRESVWSGYSL